MPDILSEEYQPQSLLHLALTCTCPRCGQGKLFSSYLKIVDQCNVCGLELKKHDSGDGPAFFVMWIVSILIIPFALLLEFKAEPPLWVHILIWPLAITIACAALLPPCKAMMVAQEYKNRILAGGGNAA